MKLAINILLSLIMLAACVWLVWPSPAARHDLEAALRGLRFGTFWPYLSGFLGLLVVTHFCRAWRWNNLLEPIGARLPPGRLLAVSSVGFMFILALPARLGEFVRPALIREKGKVSASAALGTVAVERIVDGLLVSLFVFGAFFAQRHSPHAAAQPWMMPTAYLALGLFTGAMVFLGFALRWPEQTVRFSVRLTLSRYYAPRLSRVLEVKLRSMIDGFRVLKDKRNLIIFVMWSVAYWGANGLSFWVLARGFGLDLPVVGAFAAMGLVAVGISLPNAPALMGQYQYFTHLGLSLYVGETVAKGEGLAFAIVLWALQVIWYIGIGALALATPYVSLSEILASRRQAPETGGGAVPAGESDPAR
ncbi:MAG TPA: lysylphosphatidylglycerol synthase transmembrane domain-containing protein [Kofleriaceae bacterium]|nr:lysylphosphatidylglycerol synthase transmembrane domain-containing protein [Kofleriaceae bacterium]